MQDFSDGRHIARKLCGRSRSGSQQEPHPHPDQAKELQSLSLSTRYSRIPARRLSREDDSVSPGKAFESSDRIEWYSASSKWSIDRYRSPKENRSLTGGRG